MNHPPFSAPTDAHTRLDRRIEVLRHNALRVGRASLLWGGGLAALGTVLLPVGVGLVVLKALLILGPLAHGVALRMGVSSVALAGIGSLRRRVALRWTLRGLWMVSLAGWSSGAVPFVGIVAIPLTLALLTAATYRISASSLRRDAAGEPLHAAEKALLAGLVGLGLAVVAGLVAAVAALGWTLSWLQDALGAAGG